MIVCIVNEVANFIKQYSRNYKVYVNRHVDLICSELKDTIRNFQHRKPDIFCLDIINRRVAVVEITVCYDLYINLALQEKINSYSPLVQMFENRGYNTKLIILYFGLLGCVEKSLISG